MQAHNDFWVHFTSTVAAHEYAGQDWWLWAFMQLTLIAFEENSIMKIEYDDLGKARWHIQ